MDASAVRRSSLRTASLLGYDTNAALPLPDPELRTREADDIAARCLVLHVMVAMSYGFPRAKAREWLEGEALLTSTTPSEQAALSGSLHRQAAFRDSTEAVWALLWTLGVTPSLDFGEPCPDDLVTMLPDLRTAQSSTSLRRQLRLRRREDIAAAADLALCIHWAVVDATVRGRRLPESLPGWAVVERRRALDWALSTDGWEDVPLDT